MKKVLLFVAAAFALAACTKENPQPQGGVEVMDSTTVEFKFSPYQMEPMKAQSAIGTVCSRLDIYIIDTLTSDTLRIHQARDVNGDGFGSASAVLKTNKSYRLVAVAHNSADTCTFSNGVVSFVEDKVKQSMVADTVFTPADGLSLTVEMKRFVGMFKLRVADTDAQMQGTTHFRFTVDSAFNKWNVPLAHGVELVERVHVVNGTTRGDDGYVTYNVYIIPDNLNDVRTVRVTVTALDAQEAVVEERVFEGVPIRAGYITKYTGTFFITFDMGFTFTVGDWGEFPDQPF